MGVRTQLTALLPNRPGMLTRLCEALSSHKINIVALSVVDTSDQSLVRMLCNNVREARRVMDTIGVPYGEAEVFALSMSNVPGALAKTASKLSRAKVNIDYLYASTGARTTKGVVVIGVSNLKRARKALKI